MSLMSMLYIHLHAQPLSPLPTLGRLHRGCDSTSMPLSLGGRAELCLWFCCLFVKCLALVFAWECSTTQFVKPLMPSWWWRFLTSYVFLLLLSHSINSWSERRSISGYQWHHIAQLGASSKMSSRMLSEQARRLHASRLHPRKPLTLLLSHGVIWWKIVEGDAEKKKKHCTEMASESRGQ